MVYGKSEHQRKMKEEELNIWKEWSRQFPENMIGMKEDMKGTAAVSFMLFGSGGQESLLK